MATVTLSVKNVPRELASKLRDRAARNHRSLQGELLAILSDAAVASTVAELAGLVKRLKLSTPADSATFVRQDRDGRRR